MKRILLIVTTILTLGAYAQDFDHYIADPNGEPREHQVDVTHMLLDVSFKPEQGEVIGKVEHSFTPLRSSVDTIFWDGPGITFKKVTLVDDGKEKEVLFNITPQGVVTRFNPPLSWDKSYKMVFEYTAKPTKGIYFIGWNTKEPTDKRNQTRRQIWTQGQGIDHRHWIPMYDNMNDKFVTETITRFDSKYKVLSNGELLKAKNNNDETTTWHYKMPGQHAVYLLMLGIGEYAIKETKTSRGTPVQFWY
jgi:aminopeptidase N